MPRPQAQARFWLLTIPLADWSVPVRLDDAIQFLHGQQERGATGYEHWQLVVHFKRAVRLSAVKRHFANSAHAEPTRSEAAEQYVLKDDTAIENTRFELGRRALKRNSKKDWDEIKALAKAGKLDDIPSDVYIQHYKSLMSIKKDNMQPLAQERTCVVLWGPTGTGKSHRAWAAYPNAYPKDPNTKYWDGYQQHEHVVIDEFRGRIDISHLLRWLDKYPVILEVKFGACVLVAHKIIITSNISPEDWYPAVDEQTKEALLRRMTIYYVDNKEVELNI